MEDTPCTGGPEFGHLGVQRDWLTFYYDVTSQDRPNNTTFASLYSIYQYACGRTPCYNNDPYWADILAGAQYVYAGQPDPYARFAQAAIVHGIDH